MSATRHKLKLDGRRWPKRVCCPRPLELLAKLKRIKALGLRLQKLSYREIARRLGCSRSSAHRYVQHALNQLPKA